MQNLRRHGAGGKSEAAAERIKLTYSHGGRGWTWAKPKVTKMKMTKLKTVAVVAVMCSALLCLTGCGVISNAFKHLHSSITGLNRKITLYDANGHTIKEWVTKAKVEDNGGTCWFLDTNDKAVTISGTFIVQEQ